MNINYKTNLNEEELLEALNLWNKDLGSIYPMDKKSFYYNIIDYKYKNYMYAYDDNKLVGFIVVKEFKEENTNYLDTYDNLAFISIFYVRKEYRKKGIGSYLLDYVEKLEKGKTLWVGKDIHNFFPAIPNDFDNLTDVFFENKGYNVGRYTHDLLCANVQNRKYLELKNKDVKYEFVKKEDKDELLEFLTNNNWKRWIYEANDYFTRKNNDNESIYLVGKLDNKIVSFAVCNNTIEGDVNYNMTWRDRFENLGGIGPLGVNKELRGNNLGYDIVAAAFNSLKNKNVSDIMIDWTGLMEFYRKFGFEVWKSYRYAYKEL